MSEGIKELAKVLSIRRDMKLKQTPPVIPNLNLSYFWNPYPYFDDENDLSLVAPLLTIQGFQFLFPGDMEKKGFRHMLGTSQAFGNALSGVHVLVASHHGRRNGICEDMFDVHGCNPHIVIISDKQHDTQETTSYYSRKARGISWFRREGPRYVLTTRSDKETRFSFNNGGALVG